MNESENVQGAFLAFFPLVIRRAIRKTKAKQTMDVKVIGDNYSKIPRTKSDTGIVNATWRDYGEISSRSKI